MEEEERGLFTDEDLEALESNLANLSPESIRALLNNFEYPIEKNSTDEIQVDEEIMRTSVSPIELSLPETVRTIVPTEYGVVEFTNFLLFDNSLIEEYFPAPTYRRGDSWRDLLEDVKIKSAEIQEQPMPMHIEESLIRTFYALEMYCDYQGKLIGKAGKRREHNKPFFMFGAPHKTSKFILVLYHFFLKQKPPRKLRRPSGKSEEEEEETSLPYWDKIGTPEMAIQYENDVLAALLVLNLLLGRCRPTFRGFIQIYRNHMTTELMTHLTALLTLYETRLKMTLRSGYPFDTPFNYRQQQTVVITPVLGEKRGVFE